MPEIVKDLVINPALSTTSDDPGWEQKTAPPLSASSEEGKAAVGEVAAAGDVIAATPPETPPAGDDDTGTVKPGEVKEENKDQTPPWVKALISKTKNEANEARREAALSRAELAKATEAIIRMSPPQQSPVTQEPVKPQRAAFDDPDEYETAMATHAQALATHAAKRAVEAFQEQQMQAALQAQARRAQAELDAFLEKGREKYEDFADLCETDSLACSPKMLSAAQRSEIGEDVIYYLGQHPKEAKRIYQMDETDQVREMTRIETRLQAETEKTKADAEKVKADAEKAKTVANAVKAPTKAPPPIKPVTSGASGNKDWEYYATKATPEEYVQWVRSGRPMT